MRKREATLPLPVDYGQLLGLRGPEAQSEPLVQAAVEELGRSELEDGYSPRAVEGRMLVLQEAAEGVRHARNHPGMEPRQLEVEWALLPGTLALLQEVGENEVVLGVGAAALERWEAGPHRRDITLAMALSHCSLAREAFGVREQAAAGCARLEEALGLLRGIGSPALAPLLADEIDGALRELQPQCVLEHLKLPLGLAHGPMRKQAINVLKALLAGGADGQSASVDATYVATALRRLTAQETVLMLEWADVARDPTATWCTPELLQYAALAHLVTGFTQRRPVFVQTADNILSALDQGGTSTMEAVVTRVLLGNPDEALDMLRAAERQGISGSSGRAMSEAYSSAPWDGYGDGSKSNNGAFAASGPRGSRASASALPPRHEALSFIRAHSDDPQDLLPGLCLFIEQWLAQVAFKQFRDLNDNAPSSSLVEFFQDGRVTGYLQQHADSQKAAAAKPLSGLQGAASGVASNLQRVFSQSPPNPFSSRSAASSQEVHGGLLTSEGKQSGASRLQSAARQPSLRIAAAALLALGLGSALLLRSRSSSQPTPRTSSLPGVSSPASQTSSQRSAPAASAASATRVPPQQQQQQQQVQSAPQLSKRSAEAVIRGWQEAKAAALGPKHDTSRLVGVVAEPWLTVVTQEASAAQESGWFWEYDLKSVSVERISEGPAAGQMRVRAKLKETGTLYAANGKRADEHAYSNPYSVEYTLQQADGSSTWLLANALVLGGK
ncbi:hypothetical protein WJX84_011187 [Apatococcus fuscideae]